MWADSALGIGYIGGGLVKKREINYGNFLTNLTS